MNDESYREKVRNLVQCCPTIFAGAEDFRFECRAGWFWILNEILGDLERVAAGSGADAEPNLRVVQFFNDTATTEIYTEGAEVFEAQHGSARPTRTEVGGLLEAAAQEAAGTCEFCGNEGELRNDLPWIRTLCEVDYLRERVRFLERDLRVEEEE
jgi:hypothetical protein